MPADCGMSDGFWIPFSDSDFFMSRIQTSSYPRLFFPQAYGEIETFIHVTKKSKLSFFHVMKTYRPQTEASGHFMHRPF